jgi:hypothetical protein
MTFTPNYEVWSLVSKPGTAGPDRSSVRSSALGRYSMQSNQLHRKTGYRLEGMANGLLILKPPLIFDTIADLPAARLDLLHIFHR